MALQPKNFFAFGLVLGIAGIAGLVSGGHKTSLAMKNSEPTRMKYADWVKSPPDKEWVVLEDVEILWNYSTKITTTTTRKGVKTGETHEYFVAGNVNIEDDAEKIQAFFIVDDAGKCALMEECWRNESNMQWLAANEGRTFEKVTIEGMVQTGLSLSSEDERILRGSGGPVAADFKIIKWGGKPDGGTGFVLLMLGLAGLAGSGGLVFLGIRANKKQKATMAAMPRAPYPVPQHPGMPPQPGMPQNGPIPYGQQPMAGHPQQGYPQAPQQGYPQPPNPAQRPMPRPSSPQARPIPPKRPSQ